MVGAGLFTFVFLLSATSLVHSQTAFTANYIKSNPSFFGFGLVNGRISYDPTSTPRSMLLTDTLSAGTVSNYYTYNSAGTGLMKHEPNCAGYAASSCEVTDINTMQFWVLWFNTTYYFPGVGDGIFPGCTRYDKRSNVPTAAMNYVTKLYLRADGSVCGWDLINGERYNITSAATYTAPANPCQNPAAATCMKPMNLVFIVDQTGPATLADINQLKLELQNLGKSLAIDSQTIYTTFIGLGRNNSQILPSPAVAATVADFSTQITAGFNCEASAPAPCNTPKTTALPDAILAAANIIKASSSYRPQTSNAIVFITWGGTTSTAAQITTALSTASTTLGSKTSASSSSLPHSSVVNFLPIVIGSTPDAKAVASTLQTVVNSNTANQIQNVRSNPYSNITNYVAGTDSVYNNVFRASATDQVASSLSLQVAAGLCATNGLVSQSRSCSGCCGDCKCGVLCVQPDACPVQNCFTQALSKAPNAADSTLCCTLQPQCPGLTTTPCNISFCNISTGACSYITPSCTPPSGFATNCYNRVCDPTQSTTSTVVCRNVQKFNSTVNSCFQRVCNEATNSVVVVPLVNCPREPCVTSVCVNSTGLCNRTVLPIPTPIAADACKDAVCNPLTNNTYIWVFPNTSSCTTTDKCKLASCVGGACSLTNKCIPNTCTSYTCDPTVGTCIASTCPQYGTFPNGTINRCIAAPACVPQAGAALSGCSLVPVSCLPPDSCQTSQCVNGVCVNTRICSLFETINNVVNQCRQLNTSSCVTGNCQYFDKPCTNAAQLNQDPGCVVASCTPSTGQCNYNIPCPKNNGNKCQTRVNCTAPCQYNTTVTCPDLKNDPCQNLTCSPSVGCTGTYPPLCSINPTGQLCTVRVNSSCVLVRDKLQPTCNYTARVCNSTDVCDPVVCLTNNGVCGRNNSLTCPRFQILNANAVCYTLNTSSCGGLSSQCTYTLTRNCSTGISWIAGTCSFSGNNSVCANLSYCNEIPCQELYGYNASLPLAQRCLYRPQDCSTVSTGNNCTRFNCANNTCSVEVSICPNISKCNISTSCTLPCTYKSPCSDIPLISACHTRNCDLTTGTCSQTNNCAYQSCRISTCIAATGFCNRTLRICPNSTNPCNETFCNDATDLCEERPKASCPPLQLVSGSTRRCSYRTSCEPCTYALNTSCTPRTPCETAFCSNSSGNCVYNDIGLSNPACPVSTAPGCTIRDNSTCVPSGSCTYNTLVSCPTPNTFPPCITSSCLNGACINTTNTSYVCTTPNDPCLVVAFNASAPSCCTTSPKCTPFLNGNRCQPQTCVAGQCQVNAVTCPPNLGASGAACLIARSGGCDTATGNCTRYGARTCTPQDKCTNLQCDNSTGNCDIPLPNPACSAACVALNCPSISACQYNDCIVDPNTGVASCQLRNITNPNATKFCAPRDFCTSVSCLDGQYCISVTKRDTDCELEAKQKGLQLPPCSRWSAQPNDPKCCAPLPNCNDGVSREFRCMITACGPDNETCVLVDNSATVCPPFQFADNKCLPLKRCINSSGSCEYYNLQEECRYNQSQIDPCFTGFCNTSTGECQTKDEGLCAGGRLCLNVDCNSPPNKCVRRKCNNETGLCELISNVTCPPLDNCTDQICLPETGCNIVEFNPAVCNVTDPCKTLVLNKDKVGCCEVLDKCPNSTDPICTPVECKAGFCFYSNFTCEEFEVDENGIVNYCRELVGCAGGCLYRDKVCNSSYPGVPCFRDVCRNDTGTCEALDTCPKDSCQRQTCNIESKKCEVNFTRVCSFDNCTQQVCDRILGCTTVSLVPTANCTLPPCHKHFLNPNKNGCCDPYDGCVSNDPCVVASCSADNKTCVNTQYCPPQKCFDVKCVVVNGAPTCTPPVAKPCAAPNNCSVVEPCVDDGTPFSCIVTPRCAAGGVAGDICLEQVCVENATGAFCVTQRNPAYTCDDDDSCTTNDCVNGTCVNTFCPTGDPCMVGVCVNGTCNSMAFDCDDRNACTNDTCVAVNGVATCEHKTVECPADACSIIACDPNVGCTSQPRLCQPSEPCIYIGADLKPVQVDKCSVPVCNDVADSIHIDCSKEPPVRWEGNGKSPIEQTNCDDYYCTNQTCTFKYRRCPSTVTIVAVAAGVSAVVVVGIVLGIIACVGCSGGAIYAVAAASKNDNAASVFNNPLFSGTQTEYANPLNTMGGGSPSH